MDNEILACLDGSPMAEKILPLAGAIAAAKGTKPILLRVVADADELASEEEYLRERARHNGAQLRILVSTDPAGAIVAELEKNPTAIAVLTTHGRTAWAEAILGSVALHVIRGSRRPVILFRPLGENGEAPGKIGAVVLALDGSDFAERVIPFAVKMAESLAALLILVQALPLRSPIPPVARLGMSDTMESSYLQRKAGEIKRKHGIDCEWEVLHGDPADAICRYVKGMPETMLAITSHARGGLERAVFGSVAADCVRRAGIPLLIYWPD